jgi:transketolase
MSLAMSHGPTNERVRELERLALLVREHAIRLSAGGGCFLGASLSCADLLVFLYKRVLQISPERPSDAGRDYLFLSKGHDVPALYGTLAELGFIDRALLRHHLSTAADIYWHPNRAVPGVEFHSGSLGHLLSVAMGVALDLKLARRDSRAYVVLGDGELNEGSIWEGFLVASALDLDNLVVVVDRNGFQANMATEDLVPLEPLADKLRAFGFSVDTVDGHDFQDLERVFRSGVDHRGRPRAVIAKTVRGRGLPSIENRIDRWFCKFDDREVEQLLHELRGGRRAALTSEGLVVR